MPRPTRATTLGPSQLRVKRVIDRGSCRRGLDDTITTASSAAEHSSLLASVLGVPSGSANGRLGGHRNLNGASARSSPETCSNDSPPINPTPFAGEGGFLDTRLSAHATAAFFARRRLPVAACEDWARSWRGVTTRSRQRLGLARDRRSAAYLCSSSPSSSTGGHPSLARRHFLMSPAVRAHIALISFPPLARARSSVLVVEVADRAAAGGGRIFVRTQDEPGASLPLGPYGGDDRSTARFGQEVTLTMVTSGGRSAREASCAVDADDVQVRPVRT